MSSDPLVQAMRVMHCCYCSDSADATVAILERGVGLSARATSKGIRADGSPLGIHRMVESDVCLVYDPRGGRVSPAIEVHGWTDPPAVGTPYDDPTNVGIQALGVAVPELAPAVERLEAEGARTVGRSDRPLTLDGRAAIVRGPDGVTFDLVEQPGAVEVRLAHLRVTCADLARSIEWYSALGWSLLADPVEVEMDGTAFGLRDATGARAKVGRLRLPDEELELLLVQWSAPPSHGMPYGEANHRGLYRLALGVADTRAATATLVAAGWTPNAPPNLIELPGTKVPDMWITFFTDPDGIVVQLVERAPDAFATAR